MATNFTPYSTAAPFWATGAPKWMSKDDAARIQTYQLYEELYWGDSATGLEIEGDGEPIRVPVARVIIEAIHRFLAVGWNFTVTGDDASKSCELAFKKLFKRERILSKVSSQKRYGLIRGDAMFHIVADPEKPLGSRISIYELDPASYFPIYDLDDPDTILGCHLVDQMLDAQENVIVRRQTYMKQVDDNGVPTGRITSELATYENDAWDDRFGADSDDIKLLKVLEEEHELPAQITSIPVYHWRNMVNPGDIFGASVIRGVEKILKSVDQTITDQDVALALASLGVYVTDSAPPTDDDGNETDWIIGPGRVIETKSGGKFTRVQGISSISPSLEHAEYLEGKARAAASVPQIAAGDVDSTVAESGIALALKFAPLLAANAERELEMIGVLDNMLFDLASMWFPAYEGQSFGDAVVESTVKDPLPVNRKAVIDETLALLQDGVITVAMAIARLAELGWNYSKEDIDELIGAAEDQADDEEDVESFEDRVNAELDVEDAVASE